MTQAEIQEHRFNEEIQILRGRIEDLERHANESQDIREQLVSSAEKYWGLFNHSPSAYALHEIIVDESGQAVDYRFLEVNEAFEKLTDMRAEDVLGQRVSTVLPGLETEPILEIFGRVADSREPVRFEHYSEILDKYLDISAFSPRQGQFATIVADVTKKKKTEEALRLRTVYFEQLFESSPLGIVLIDNDDRVVECNEGFERLFGFKRDEAQGRKLNTLIVVEDHFTDASMLSERVLQGSIVDTEGVRYRKDGSPVDVRILAHPIRLDDKQIGIYGIYSDISRRKRDALTRLVNRPTFMERLEIELVRAARESKLTAVLAMDLAQLKDVNDTYGLGVGDSVLQAVAQRLRETLREGASIARLGGDEFGILQVDLTDVGNAAGLARRLLATLEKPLMLGHHRIHVSATIGIAIAPSESHIGAQQLVSQAERALTQAKRDGHTGYKFHAAQMDRDVQARMLLGQELHGAVDRNELFLEYQPQIGLPEQSIVGVEALLRWRHPKGTVIGPDHFVPVAEASGVIVPIGDWVLRTACQQAVQWQTEQSQTVPVAVNLSAVQFKNPDFAQSVVDTLEETGLSPDLLELELTERILVEATDTVTKALSRLQNIGVRLTLDDFGKGYSSMEYLRVLPLQKLKIDRSFVQNLEDDSNDAAIVSAITVLGSKLGLTVVAEGVERQSQLDMLAAEGCHEIQGYFFSPPVSPEKVSQLMSVGNDSIRPISLTH